MQYTSYEEIRAELRKLLWVHDYRGLRLLLQELNEVDIAEFLNELDEPNAALLFRMLPKDIGVDVFAHLDADAQEALITAYTDKEIQELVAGLFNDDLADMMEELPAVVAKRVLANTSNERRDIVNKLLQYPEESAGSIMTTEYMHLKQDMTVAEAIAKLRHSSPRLEMIYTCFVTTFDRILEGVITVRELLTAKDEEIIGDLMERSIVSVKTTDDQEEVAMLFDRYDFLAIPVVDRENRLVGIVTVDDAVDVMTEETSEDLSIMAAVQPSEKPYLQTGVWDNAKRRVVWLLLLMISGMINGSIVGNFEHAFVAMPILVTFIPMLTDTGGNAGSQSSGLLLRGIALGEIELRDIGRVIWKEFRIAIVVGVVLSLVNGLRIFLMHGHDPLLSVTVSLALLCTVVAAKLIGGCLPLLAKAVKLDPAIMAAPLITTIVDALSLVIYFGIANLILPALS